MFSNTCFTAGAFVKVIFVALLGGVSLSLVASPPNENFKKTDWNAMVFRDEDKVLKVQLVLKRYGVFLEDKDKVPSIDITTSDQTLCRRTRHGITDSWRRVPQASFGATGGEPYGELRVQTSSGNMLIGLYDKFALNDLYENSDNCFISFDLAVVVDDLHLKASGKKLDRKRFNALAGQHCPKSQSDKE